MPLELACSPACERNKRPIAAVLRSCLPETARVLEIGSGTAQHAVYFAECFPALRWQCSDRAENLCGINARISQQGQGRLEPAIALDVMTEDWPSGPFDAVFTANTLHIMPWSYTGVLLRQAAAVLKRGACLLLYGPFHDGGVHTAPSNLAFDLSLKATDSQMGVRDALEIKRLAFESGLLAEADLALPANNRMLIFRKPVDAPK